MAEGKKSILFYVDWGETFNALTDEQAGKLIKHLCAYVNDENPQTDDPIVNAVFVNIRQQLKRDLKKYEDMCLKNKENGKKGGRPKKETEENPNKPNGFSKNPTKAKKPDTDTDTDIDIDINNIYSLYPSRCVIKNSSTGKGSKNKEQIKKLLSNGETKDSLEKVIKFYVDDCKRNKVYMKNFTTFLNNLPEVHEVKEQPRLDSQFFSNGKLRCI